MTSAQHETPDLGVYALGGLSEAEKAEIDAHVAGCATCRDQLAELTAIAGRLGEVPPEFFLEGPPEGGDLLVQRAVSRVRAERRSALTRRRVLTAAAAAVVAVALLGAGAVAGRQSAPTPVASGPTSTPTSTPVAGTRTAAATDPGTGARLSAQVVPAAGWVRVSATVTGIPAGQRCRIVVVGAGGERQTAGSWVVSAKGAQDGTMLNGSALVDPARVTAVLVENFEGRQFVSAPLA
ncbi:MAG TPA: zf-HC2 domain-containing protein [Mycobacteriales bacterium]